MSDLPNTMMAVEITEPGGPEVLRPTERQIPRPAQGEVLIRVAAAGVNGPDLMQRRGQYPPPAGASDIPGLEVAGTVVELGDGVTGLAVGDPVTALVTGGGYAEYCAAAAPLCLPFPAGFDAIQAAALPETFFTVWTNVFDRGRLAPGETLLVHGGAGGIGTTAIQLAVAFGARVIITAGSDAKCLACSALGADAAVNYRTEDFVERVSALTAGQGVDVILDIVGADYLPRNLNCLNVEGRLLQIALRHGSRAEIDLLPILLKRLTLTGSTLRPRSVAQKQLIADELRQRVWPLLDAAKVKPVIYASVPLADAAEAHRIVEAGEHIGKVMLTGTA